MYLIRSWCFNVCFRFFLGQERGKSNVLLCYDCNRQTKCKLEDETKKHFLGKFSKFLASLYDEE